MTCSASRERTTGSKGAVSEYEGNEYTAGISLVLEDGSVIKTMVNYVAGAKPYIYQIGFMTRLRCIY